MKAALIGYSGFVGGNLLSQQSFTHTYNSKNIGEIAGQEFDLVVCAGAPAAMWIANKEPEKDWACLQTLMTPLATVTAKHVVLISTIAVYPRPVEVDEDSPVDVNASTPYGKHRFALERFVADSFDATIVRLPGLFGPGLKKNIIYDFLHNNNLHQVNARSVYQFYDLRNLTKDIAIARKEGIRLLNISSAPTSTAEVASSCFGLEFQNVPAGTPAFFDYRSKYAARWGGAGGYLYSKEQTLAALRRFVDEERRAALRTEAQDEGKV